MGRRAAICLVIAVSGILVGVAAAAEPKKPNILIFLSDDVGWGEYGFQGGKDIPTPNIDSLAKNGVRFTQGYVSGPYCSPTRAGLMTGRYQTRFGHEFNSVAAQSGLSLKETTLADRLRSLGYATCAIGKWHLGAKPEYNPLKRGFDEFYGTLGNTPYFHPTKFVDSRVSPDVQTISDDNFYTTDQYSERALDWIGKQQDRPWFLYFPFNAQHAPLQAPQKYLDRFANIADEKRRSFAACMSAMDDTVGRVLEKLRATGQEENTLIFFFSDNGGPTPSTTSSNGPLRGFKATTWEGGVRIPFCAQWKGQIPAGKTYENPIIQLDLLPTCITAAGGTVETSWQLDGVNLLPYLKGENTGKPHETLYWRFGNQWAIRHGDWKLVVGRGIKQPGLFNLADDLAEANDQSEKQPAKVQELQALWQSWNAEQAPPSSPQEKEGGKKKNKRQAKQKPASA
jgi:arylsulfatase A-like enzyme